MADTITRLMTVEEYATDLAFRALPEYECARPMWQLFPKSDGKRSTPTVISSRLPKDNEGFQTELWHGELVKVLPAESETLQGTVASATAASRTGGCCLVRRQGAPELVIEVLSF